MISYHKALINVKAYLPNDNEIISIIKLCNLRNDINNWKIWYDDLGNKIILNKKNIKIEKDNSFIIKDIRFKLHPKNIIKNSKLLFIKIINNVSYCLFYSDDNIKLSIYKNNMWEENLSPLNAGIDNIINLIQNVNITNIKNIDDNTVVILSSMKVNRLLIKDNNEMIYKTLESLGLINAS